MIEIPESHVYARQAGDMLSGRTVTDVFNATYPHKFTWYTGDPAAYRNLLAGKKFLSAAGYGAFVDLLLEDKVLNPLYTQGTAWDLRDHLTGACRDARGWFVFTGVTEKTA